MPWTPREHKRLRRNVRGFDNAAWDREHVNIALVDQFQNIRAKSRHATYCSLLSTGDRQLAGASPFDILWRIRLRADDPAAQEPSTWRGNSLLGHVLKDVRQLIRAADISASTPSHRPALPLRASIFPTTTSDVNPPRV